MLAYFSASPSLKNWKVQMAPYYRVVRKTIEYQPNINLTNFQDTIDYTYSLKNPEFKKKNRLKWWKLKKIWAKSSYKK